MRLAKVVGQVVATDEGDKIYCAACNRLAITLTLDP